MKQGYHGRDDLTRDRFIPNTFCSDPGFETLYRTGDLCRIDEESNVYVLFLFLFGFFSSFVKVLSRASGQPGESARLSSGALCHRIGVAED